MNPDDWDFDLDAVLAAINQHQARNVLLQFPDGLKPHAFDIIKELAKSSDAEFSVWQGSNFGACDIPVEAKFAGVDLIVHFGHEAWNYKREVIN